MLLRFVSRFTRKGTQPLDRETCCLFFFYVSALLRQVWACIGVKNAPQAYSCVERMEIKSPPPKRPCIPSRLEKISLHPLSHQRCKALVCVRASANLLSHGFDYWDGTILNRIQKLLWRASQPTPVVGLWIGPKKKKKDSTQRS